MGKQTSSFKKEHQKYKVGVKMFNSKMFNSYCEPNDGLKWEKSFPIQKESAASASLRLW